MHTLTTLLICLYYLRLNRSYYERIHSEFLQNNIGRNRLQILPHDYHMNRVLLGIQKSEDISTTASLRSLNITLSSKHINILLMR